MPNTGRLFLLRVLRLACSGEPRERDRFQTRVGNWFAGHFANAVGAELDPLQRLVDFVKGVLLLGKETKREIAIVSVAAGVCLVHAEGGGFAAFRAGTQVV